MNSPFSSFLSLNLRDVSNAIVLAVVVAVLGALQQFLTKYGLHFSLYDWGMITELAVTAGIGAFVKALGTTQEGKFLGAVKIK